MVHFASIWSSELEDGAIGAGFIGIVEDPLFFLLSFIVDQFESMSVALREWGYKIL
jgi:hypothetical protein